MKSKIIIILLSISFLSIFIQGNTVKACDIVFEITDGEKTSYSIGDVVVVKITISFTHRVCSEGINSTEFDATGMEILSATAWSESTPNVWSRKIKIEVTEIGKLELVASRSCDKDGGFGSILISK
jgi:hypothetical protein